MQRHKTMEEDNPMDQKMISQIAIVTLYDEINIGNKLQNYALQQILRQYAKTVDTLSYKEASSITPLLGWKGKMVLKFGFPKSKAEEKKAILERWNRFNQFSKEYLRVCSPKKFSDYNADVSDQYDFFVVGSDQVWHNFSCTNDEIKYFMLRFVEKRKRICFAPSFGFDSIPESFRDEYITGFNGFRMLSCREKSGCKMINDMTQRTAELMPDPTIGLSASEWGKIEKHPEYTVPDQFILSYFIGNKSKENIEEIDNLSASLGLPIIDVFDKKNLSYFMTRPDEFLYLIQRTNCVLTNSFHGSVFAIIFHKKFRLFARSDTDGKTMSARLNTLLEEFHMERNNNGFFETHDDVDTALKAKRRIIDDYLQRSFSVEKTIS